MSGGRAQGRQTRVPTTEELMSSWQAAADAPPTLEELAPRVHAASPPWDLDALAAEAVRGTTAVLEVTSGAPRIAPDGFTLVHLDPDVQDPGNLPYPERCIDVVVDRHGGYDAAEVARVLRPGGVLLSDQVAGDDVVDLHAVFGAPLPRPHVTLDARAGRLADAGLDVTRREPWHGPLAFDDVAALVSYLTRVPWRSPADFMVDGYGNTLIYLHMRAPAWGQPLVFTQSRFLLRAERPL